MENEVKTFDLAKLLAYVEALKATLIEYKNVVLKTIGVLLGLILLCIVSVISGVLHHIPLISNLLEFVGLGYSVYFFSRYLVKQTTRIELVSVLNRVKDEIVGRIDDDPNT